MRICIKKFPLAKSGAGSLLKLILHHIFSNKIIFENLVRPWRSLDSSTHHLQISVNERGGFARDDNCLRENNGKEEAAIRNKNFSIFERFRSNRRFFLPSYTQKTCHPDPASAGEGSPNHYNEYFIDSFLSLTDTSAVKERKKMWLKISFKRRACPAFGGGRLFFYSFSIIPKA